MTQKIDKLRRTNPQKIVTNGSNLQGKKVGDSDDMTCRYYHNGKYCQKGHHTNGGHSHKLIFSFCNSNDKRLNHPVNEYRNSRHHNKSTKSK